MFSGLCLGTLKLKELPGCFFGDGDLNRGINLCGDLFQQMKDHDLRLLMS
jgi:hypothetical protein